MRSPALARFAQFGLTARGWWTLAAAVLAFGLATWWQVPVLLWVCGLALTLLVIALLHALAVGVDVLVDRSDVPPFGEVQAKVVVRVGLRNRSGRPLAEGLWQDPVSGLPGASGVFPALGPAGSVDADWDIEYELRAPHRGRYVMGPLRLESTDPFGLVAFRRVVPGTAEIVVLPHREPLPAVTLAGAGTVGATVSSPISSGPGDQDVIPRRYAAGDPLKRVNWKATARLGRLMVRQPEQDLRAQVRVIVDTDPVAHGTSREAEAWSHSSTLEWCVSAAASVLTDLPRRGFDVALDCGSTERLVDSAAAQQAALVDLAVLTPSPEADQHPDRRGEGTVVLLLGVADAATVERHLVALGSAAVVVLASTHSPVAVLDRIRANGWTCLTYDTHDAVADVWDRLPGGGR